ncbi:MAG: type I-E CRISPR-associated protein Cse2/CasB [Acutalibacteraceae bacterium]
MSSKTQNVGHFVEYRLKCIANSSSDGSVKASLANLRRGIGTTPGDIPELWELFLQDLPEEMLSRSGVPTHAQWSVYIALTLFALHQQGKDLQKESMYRQGNGLGKAVACLIHGEDDKTRKATNVLATSADIQELAHHLRGIQLLRSEGILGLS